MIKVILWAGIALLPMTETVRADTCQTDAKVIRQVHELNESNLVYQTGPTPKHQIIEIYKAPEDKFAIVTIENECIEDVVYRDVTGAFYFLEEGLKAN